MENNLCKEENKQNEQRPPIEWYEKQLNDCRKEINKLNFENQQLKDVVIYLALKLKDREDTLLYLNSL